MRELAGEGWLAAVVGAVAGRDGVADGPPEGAVVSADQATKPAPCLVCGRGLDPVQPGSTQPVGALMLTGSGNWGSDFDPLNGTELQVSVCDPCLLERSVRVLHVRTTTTVNWDVRPWNPRGGRP